MDKLPPLIKDFIKRAAPDAENSPIRDLQDRYGGKSGEIRRDSGFVGPLPARDSTEYIVEIRIREWMMRVQKEAEEEKKLKELHARLNRPHNPPGGPDKPPNNPNNRGPGNKISPS